jgi:MFS family permease
MKWPTSLGMLFVAVSAGSLSMWHDESWQILLPMALLGIGVGFAYAGMATLITESVRLEETGVATGMNTVMRTVGGVVGGQVGAALLAAYVIGNTSVPSVTGYETMFALAAVAAAVGAGVAALVTPPARLRRRAAATV